MALNGTCAFMPLRKSHGGRHSGRQKKMVNMELDMVANMEVDKTADKVADMFKTKCTTPEISKTKCIIGFISLGEVQGKSCLMRSIPDLCVF